MDNTILANFLKVHGPQLYGSGVPASLWESVYTKTTGNVFDASAYVEFAQDEDTGNLLVISTKEAEANSYIILVDHAWTFKLGDRGKMLTQDPSLLKRVEEITNCSPDDGTTDEQRCDAAAEALWKYAGTYRMATADQMDTENIWYLNDEVGSRFSIEFEGENFRFAPFLLNWEGRQEAFTLVWPIADVEAGDICSRNPLTGVTGLDLLVRRLAWSEETLTAACTPALLTDEQISSNDVESQDVVAHCVALCSRLQPVGVPRQVADMSNLGLCPSIAHALSEGRKIKVYTDIPYVKENLTSPAFAFTEDIGAADLVYSMTPIEHLHSALGKGVTVNQFPNEDWLAAKNEMLHTVVNAYGGFPDWLPISFDMTFQLPELVGRYFSETLNSPDNQKNLWILKPHRMARSLDVTVTNSLPCLIRMAETGPKVACQYINPPLTIWGKKTDYRFIVVVKSFTPKLVAYVFRPFWVRVAMSEYKEKNFDDMTVHLTLNKYREGFDFRSLPIDADVIAQYEQENKGKSWSDVRQSVDKALWELLYAVHMRYMGTAKVNIPAKSTDGSTLYPLPPAEVSFPHEQCRAVYGFDVMMTDKGDARILECSFCPDCERACHTHPFFHNELFKLMFLNEESEHFYPLGAA